MSDFSCGRSRLLRLLRLVVPNVYAVASLRVQSLKGNFLLQFVIDNLAEKFVQIIAYFSGFYNNDLVV